MASSLLFVNKDGNDSNDGQTWGRAKLTISNAIAALPNQGSSGTLRDEGTIMIGPGQFAEQIQLVNRGIRLIGCGVDMESAGNGTEIFLPNSTNDNLIEHTGAFTDYPHAVVISNLTLNANGDNNTSGDCVAFGTSGGAGGFNTVFDTVYFKDAEDYGIHFADVPVSCTIRNCTGPLGAGTNMDAVFRVDSTSGNDNGLLRIHDFECDDVPIVLDVSDASTGNTNLIVLRDLKVENGTAVSTAIVRHNKTVEGDAVRIVLDGLSYANYAAGGNMNSIFELNDTGGPHAQWAEACISMRSIVAPEVDYIVDDNVNTTTEAMTTAKAFRGGVYWQGSWTAY